ncbi:MAG: MaoC family dehydratase [Mycobacteriales bacterium]|nr:MaoC family dehydratase [Mycobacteriales bacterium]
MTSDPRVDRIQALVGTRLGPSDWLLVDQERVDRFADATDDHQWIHVDVERAATGPFGGTVAHGYLTVSLLPALASPLMPTEGFASRLNYGSDKVRFPAPLRVGTRVRAWSTPVSVDVTDRGVLVKQRVEIEAEGSERPICVAEALALLIPG